ncbi:MAG: 3-keto-5-aminohexanoate cleavage protein [Paracoccaceae bacterium]
MRPLPALMVAPNGATKTKADHPALPMTIPELVACATACHAAGADGLHAHVRDAAGRHVLDAGLYAELLAELSQQVPQMQVQITTEAVGRYSPAQQRALVETLRPAAVSIALREITAEPDSAVTRRFFAFCEAAEIAVQHILYDSADVARFGALRAEGILPDTPAPQVLHVLGRYATGQRSVPTDLDAPLRAQAKLGFDPDWAICAFGPEESVCLLAAHRAGGKVRIGFENNLFAANGDLAADNVAQVAAYLRLLAD